MNKNRLEAFSDGVIAIIITIMVLEIKVPHEPTIVGLLSLLPVFLSYVLSFIYVAIYWNNHHHLFHSAHKISGKVMWANMHLLFWLSLFPFATGWMGENKFAQLAVGFYGVILLMAAFAFYYLVSTLTILHGSESVVTKAVGKKKKEKISIYLYLIAVLISQWEPWISLLLYLFVAVLWIRPDTRIENALKQVEKKV